MRILIGGGGTGGHLFPCLAVANRLAELHCKVLYVGTINGIESRKQNMLPLNHTFLNVKGIRGKGVKTILNLFSLMKSVREALRIVRNFKPNKVVLFGGYVSFPLGISAWLSGVPLVLQEQNSIPGKTNRILSHFAEKILCGYRNGVKFFGEKAVFVGNPVRKEVVMAAKMRNEVRRKTLSALHFSSNRKTLLVMGGSQGALWLNEIMKKSVPFFERYRDKLQIVHITGEGKSSEMFSVYRKANIDARVFPFFEEVWKLYAVADGIVSRSGASAISEIALFGLPALFVPFPYAVDDHQYYNAKEIEEQGGCFLRRQREITPELFVELTGKILFDTIVSSRLSKNIKTFGIEDSTERVVREISSNG